MLRSIFQKRPSVFARFSLQCRCDFDLPGKPSHKMAQPEKIRFKIFGNVLASQVPAAALLGQSGAADLAQAKDAAKPYALRFLGGLPAAGATCRVHRRAMAG